MRTKNDGSLITCNKQGYSKKEAETSLNLAKTPKGHSRRRKNIDKMRVYPCPICKSWHLTSKGKYE